MTSFIWEINIRPIGKIILYYCRFYFIFHCIKICTDTYRKIFLGEIYKSDFLYETTQNFDGVKQIN